MDEIKTGKELVVFQGRNIRRTGYNNEWWFSVFDIVSVLTESTDAKQYIKKMRSRDSILNANWGTICTPLKLHALDGKIRNTNCVNTEGARRVHVDKSFVLTFEIDEEKKIVKLLDYDHHDNIY